VVIASGEDLFADLYQALGHEHLDDGAGPVLSAEGHEATRELVLRLLAELPTDEIATASELWRAIGLALPERAPRKGLLQAAAKVGVRIFTPDLTSGPFGGALLAARARGITLALDAPEDVVALGHLLAEQPRLGVIRVGIGAADALLAQARDALPLRALSAPTPSALITLEAPAGAVSARADAHAIALPVEASLALPLLVTALAQRLPDGRPRPQPVQPTFMQEPALA
jgi:deoxyhypusine synthase